jgi:type II secretory ATPase GspE/PulE/Tfp pilus assembly ATPase PilB-like protein
MLRALFVLAVASVLWATGAGAAFAQDQDATLWPSSGPFTRGTGFYLDPWKMLLLWFVFLCWVRSTDWVSQDAQQLKLRWAMWNPIVFFTFFVGLLLFFIISVWPVGFGLLLVTYVAPLVSYIVYRNKQVRSSYDKVFTGRHIKRVMARKLNAIGIKVAGADIDPRELGPAIEYKAEGGANEREDSINLITVRQSAAYMPSRELINDALQQRATHVMLDFTPQAVAVRYQVDGVWHDRSSLEREAGDPIIEAFKTLAALKPADRRSRQAGTFGMTADKIKYTVKITTQGTQTGERALLQFDPVKVPKLDLKDMGMREKMLEQVNVLMTQKGMFVFSSMPAGGLTTTIDQVLSQTDRYMRNFVEVAEVTKPHRDIENVHLTTYSAAAGETSAGVLPKLIRTYPDVIVLRDVADLETLTILCEQAANEDRLVITSTRAKEAVEALLRLMMLKIPPADFAPGVIGVLNVRLVRKLCEKCKEAYPPPPEVLKQLGLPAGRIENLYRTPTQPIDPKKPDVVCDLCNGIGYFGRTGIFELLTVDDNIRKVLTTAPKLENLRLIARKLKHRSLQEEGVLLVARGVTSIQELLRVLKQ